MNRRRTILTTALALAATIGLTGCFGLDGQAVGAGSTTAAVAPPTPSSTRPSTPRTVDPAAVQAATEAAKAKYQLPDGYDWPADTDGNNAERYWACIRLDAAWAAIDAGDPAEADAILAPALRSPLFASDPPTFETTSYAREWGWHGICTTTLGTISYPVQGLYKWRPAQKSCSNDYATDGGERRGALGTAELDADGHPVTYIVAPGDTPINIAERFCITDVLSLNGIDRYIQPGERLIIDPTAPRS